MAKTPVRAVAVPVAPAAAILSTAVHAAILEIDTALLDMQDAQEGLSDFVVLDLTDDARVAVGVAIQQYARRQEVLVQAKRFLEALLTDGYPALEIAGVTPSVLADLQANQATIAAALARFTAADPVTSLGLVAGTPEVK